MNHTSQPGMILGLLLICSGGFLYASDAIEFRQRAKALRKEASELAERGNKEQAVTISTGWIDGLRDHCAIVRFSPTRIGYNQAVANPFSSPQHNPDRR